MGAIRTAIMTILQIQVVLCARTTVVTGEEGQGMDFTCEYPADIQNNSKSFCRAEQERCIHLIRTLKNDQWMTNGRFSLYDNTSAGLFVVRVDSLYSKDSGTYWCGVDISDNPGNISVVQLNVTHIGPGLPASPRNIIVDKRNLPMFLTAVSCLAALLFVFPFTLCLLFIVKKRRQALHRGRAREMSSEYMTMKCGVEAEPNHCSCLSPDSTTFSNIPPTTRLCDHLLSKQRESTGLEDHMSEDLSVHMSQYQNLDLSCVEEHIYHGINTGSKQAL